METQRRISKLQEATKGLSIIDFSKDGRDKFLHTDGGLRAAGGEDTTAENRGGAGGTSHPPHLHELHRLTTVRESTHNSRRIIKVTCCAGQQLAGSAVDSVSVLDCAVKSRMHRML